MIETRLLSYFLTVAREQNITKAASVLHITQPTLSRQMSLLEEEMGVRLFMIGSSNLSTNSAQMVRAGMGYALTVEGSLPFLDEREICMRPMYPELYATSVLAWKRNQPFSGAANAFIQFAKCFLGMNGS